LVAKRIDIDIANLDDARLTKVKLLLFTALGAHIAEHSHDEADEEEVGNVDEDGKKQEQEQRMAIAGVK
jgi:hypothetical protein